MDSLEVIAIIFIVFVYLNLNDKLKKFDKRLKKSERKLLKEEAFPMSEMIKSLIGKKCIITDIDGIISKKIVTLVDADDEWIKTDYSNEIIVQRIEDIKKITQVHE